MDNSAIRNAPIGSLMGGCRHFGKLAVVVKLGQPYSGLPSPSPQTHIRVVVPVQGSDRGVLMARYFLHIADDTALAMEAAKPVPTSNVRERGSQGEQ